MANIKEYLDGQQVKRSAELEELQAENAELKKRLAELEKVNEESNNEEELKAAGAELDELKAKIAEKEAEIAEKQAEVDELKEQLAEIEKPADGEQVPQRNKLDFMKKEERGVNKMNIEERKEFAEKFVETRKAKYGVEETRAVLVSSGKVATPTEVSGINDNGFVGVSSIIDLVKVVDCVGMGANRVSFSVTDSEAGVQTEGQEQKGAGATFDYVDIKPTSIEVIDEISKQTKKQSPLNYENKVREKAMLGLRKKAAELVTNAVLNSENIDTMTIAAIDQNTVRDIALSYGGDEGIEGAAYLFLNKADLHTLGKVRGSNEKKAVFEIIVDANPNTGVIKDGGTAIKYCLNKNLPVGTMLYGQPQNIELDLFSDYEIRVSEDYAITKLMDTIVGDAELGAEVVAYHGITKITVG